MGREPLAAICPRNTDQLGGQHIRCVGAEENIGVMHPVSNSVPRRIILAGAPTTDLCAWHPRCGDPSTVVSAHGGALRAVVICAVAAAVGWQL